MIVWIFNHYAGPGWGLTRSYDLGRRLVAAGHQVTVFASSFSHYSLRHEVEFSEGQRTKREFHDGVQFVWLKTSAYSRNDWRRYANTASFAFRGTLAAMTGDQRPDVVVGSSAHLLAPLAAWLAAKRHGAHFVFEIRDLWPQVLIDMGKLREGAPFTRLLRALERFLYARADSFIILMPGAESYLARYGVPASKVEWIPNGVDVVGVSPAAPTAAHVRPFRVTYVGGIQEYNGLDALLEAARRLELEEPGGVVVEIFGDGTDRPRLERRVRDQNASNVHFRGLVPKSHVRQHLLEADVLFHSFKRLPVFQFGVSPVKIPEYLSAGRPIIYAVEGRNNAVAEAGAGITIPPEDPTAIVSAVRRLRALTPQEREAIGRRGTEYAASTFSFDLLAKKLERCLLVASTEPVVPREYALKRAFDVLGAGIAIVLVSIPLLVVSLLVRLTSPGPAFYVSPRVGRNNKLFDMYKFRTMRRGTPAVATHLFNDYERYLTPFGRWLRLTSIDELPQLLNVLKGEMSLVGPRPALFNQSDLIGLRTDRGVHLVRPGLTGWAQINGRDDLPIPQKVEYDAYYVQHATLGLDLAIVARTFFKVVSTEGVRR